MKCSNMNRTAYDKDTVFMLLIRGRNKNINEKSKSKVVLQDFLIKNR